MAIKFPSAALPKNEADTQMDAAQNLGSAQNLGNVGSLRKETLPKNCAATFDDIVNNTAALFAAWGKNHG